MRSATLTLFFALACLGSLATCGSNPTDDGNLLVTLSNLPMRASTLSLTATLNGTPAMSAQQVTPPADGRLGVVLPSGAMGRLVITVQVTDSDGCMQASGVGDTMLTGKYAELPINLAVKSPRQCGGLPGCAAGTICAFSPKPSTNNLWGLWASSNTDIWAVGDNSTALHYDGTSWQAVQIPSPYNYYSVWGNSAKDIWAVGQLGIIVHYDGRTWNTTPSPTTYDLQSVYGISATDIWAVGLYNSLLGQSDFLHWDGTSWKRLTTVFSGSLLSVWASAPNDITASGLNGSLIHYNGTAWSLAVSGTLSDLRSVWGLGANQVFAAGAMGTLLRNDGTGWKKQLVSGYAATLYGLGGDANAVYAVGNNNATGNTVKGTPPFTSFNVQSSPSNDLTSIVVRSNGIGWVVGKLGYIGYFDSRP